MDLPKETQEKISQLQVFEQKLHGFISQRQAFQSQLLEVENARSEVEKTDGPVYKITGGIMVKSDKDSVKKDLIEREEVMKVRLVSINKQEKSIREEAERLQKEVMSELDSNHKEAENGKSN